MSSQRKDQAIRNYRGGRQYQDEYQKVGPELICSMLEQCRGAMSPVATQLLEEMARHGWTITATLHSGGHGGRGRTPDRALHFTVRIRSQTYHFRCRAKNRGFYIYDITS